MFQAFNLAEFRREMSDFLPVGICIIDNQLTVHHWNRRLVEWTGFKAHEMFGQSLLDCFPEVAEARIGARIDDAFRSGCPVTFSAAIHRYVLRAKSAYSVDGIMHQDVVVLPLLDHPDHAIFVVTDVTRRSLESDALRTERQKLKQLATSLQRQAEALKQAEEKAQAASRAKSEFLANVSHEIRTPMTAILGFADVLQDFDVTKDEARNAVTTIRANGEHLLQLINDILDISKIEAGRLDMSITECRLPELIDDLNQLFAPRAHQRGLSFEIEITPFTPTVFLTDVLRLKQVLINLLSNAFKFTEVGSVRLRVALLIDGSDVGRLTFEVQDSGVGMSDEQVGKLFQSFVQVDTSATRRFQGTGLGLVISKRICELLGGDIRVTSQSKIGTKFTVSLPVNLRELKSTAVPLNRATSKASSPASESTLCGIRVLVAEDGPDNQKLLTFRLRKEQADFKIVGDGEAALKAVKQAIAMNHPYDIVLMDMQMPLMDGYEASTAIRQAGIDVPIIALTANAMASDRQQCLDAGCTDYQTKPINWPSLRAMMIQLTDAALQAASSTDSSASVSGNFN